MTRGKWHDPEGSLGWCDPLHAVASLGVVWPFTSLGPFAYNGNVLVIVLKLLYVLWLVIYMYLSMFWAGIVAFFRVTFFGV